MDLVIEFAVKVAVGIGAAVATWLLTQDLRFAYTAGVIVTLLCQVDVEDSK